VAPGVGTALSGGAVNRNPASAYYGFFYAADKAAHKVRIFQPANPADGTDAIAYQDTGKTITPSTTSGNTPWDISIGADDVVWLIDLDGHKIESAPPVPPGANTDVAATDQILLNSYAGVGGVTSSNPRAVAVSGRLETGAHVMEVGGTSNYVRLFLVRSINPQTPGTVTHLWSKSTGYGQYGATLDGACNAYIPKSAGSGYPSLFYTYDSAGSAVVFPPSLSSWQPSSNLVDADIVKDAAYPGGGYVMYTTRAGASPYTVAGYRYALDGTYLDGFGPSVSNAPTDGSYTIVNVAFTSAAYSSTDDRGNVYLYCKHSGSDVGYVKMQALSAGDVVISQAYGGGGDVDSTYASDYIELFNRGRLPVDLSKWSIQFTASTGTLWTVCPLTGVIQPGRYFLVRGKPGAYGASLPAPDATLATLDFSTGSGKVALVVNQTAFSSTSGPVAGVIDLIGCGTANYGEGGTTAPALTTTTAAFRAAGGTQDTNNNGADFTAGAPAPRNSNTPGIAMPRTSASANGPLKPGDTLYLNATDVAGGSFSWTGPSGFTSAVQNPVLAGIGTAAQGYYLVRATKDGVTSTVSAVYVGVSAPPVTTAGSNAPLCAGGTLNLTATSVSGGVFTWTGPNGFTSCVQNPSIANVQPNQSGTYSVVVTLNGQPSAASSVSVAVNSTPAIVTPPATQSVCAGSPLTLTVSATGGDLHYAWKRGETSVGDDSPTYAVASAGSSDAGDYTVTVSNGCGTAPAHTPATVTIGARPAISTQPHPTSARLGESAAFSVAADGEGLTYQWKKDGVDIPNANSATYSVAFAHASDAGSYTVDVSNACGPTPSNAATLTVGGGDAIPARFGKGGLITLQTRPTEFGDNVSELDGLYAAGDGDNLRLGITGNLEAGNNGIVVLLDTKPGGSRTFNFTGGEASLRIYGLNGDALDEGFAPAYAVDLNYSSGLMYADLYDLQANAKTYLGAATAGSPASGAALAGGVSLAFDNSNTSGVLGLPPPPDAASQSPSSGLVEGAGDASSGIELSLPLSILGGPTGPVRVMVLLQANGDYHSNQTLPGLPDTYGNLGSGDKDYAGFPGRQYAEVSPARANDLDAASVKWAYVPRYLTGDGSLDAHPPVSSPPTAYNGRAYVVEDVAHADGSHTGNLIALNAATGALDTAFGVNGRVALDAPSQGRVVVKGIAGVVRLFVVTSKATAYSCAVDGGSVRRAAIVPGGSTAATPAVVDRAGTAVIYAPVHDPALGWILARLEDTDSAASAMQLPLVGATDVTASPTLIQDGTHVQVAAAAGSGGIVYTVSEDLSTVFNAASTAAPVLAAPVLSLDSRRFYVGSAPASGNGRFYAFNAVNGNLEDDPATGFGAGGAVEVDGGVEQPAFMDYPAVLENPCTALFGTTTGALYGLRHTDGAAQVSFAPGALGGRGLTGAPVFVKPSYAATTGWLYAPTAQGVFAVNTGSPGTSVRYPVAGACGSPSAAGRTAGDTVAVGSGAGNVYGLAGR
jgi:hypothetical protein